MKQKILLVLLSLLLVSSSMAQTEGVVKVEGKRSAGRLESGSDQQSLLGYSIYTLFAYAQALGIDDAWVWGDCVSKSKMKEMHFYLRYYCAVKMKIRFHVLVNGPDHKEYISKWHTCLGDDYYYYWISSDSFWDWIKWETGKYEVLIKIETKKGNWGRLDWRSFGFILSD